MVFRVTSFYLYPLMMCDESRKIIKVVTLMDDLTSLIGHQNKKCNHSITFNTLKGSHYLTALNSHQDNDRYTPKNNHLQLCLIAA